MRYNIADLDAYRQAVEHLTASPALIDRSNLVGFLKIFYHHHRPFRDVRSAAATVAVLLDALAAGGFEHSGLAPLQTYCTGYTRAEAAMQPFERLSTSLEMAAYTALRHLLEKADEQALLNNEERQVMVSYLDMLWLLEGLSFDCILTVRSSLNRYNTQLGRLAAYMQPVHRDALGHS